MSAFPDNPLRDLLESSGGSAEGRQRALERYAFAVPNAEALAAIARSAPNGVVELGAGTGYWAAQLQRVGVDVVAYDTAPPPSPDNSWFSRAECFHEVLRGDVADLDRHGDQFLLLSWPTNGAIWPADAVQRFHAAGGSALAYVGEPPGGRTGDDVLHKLLGDIDQCHQCAYGVVDRPCVCDVPTVFELVGRVAIPTWPGFHDRVGLYTRTTDLAVTPNRRRRRWQGLRGRRSRA